ncbi:MAG: hypothetical protein EHM61_10420 [Acidobacteria bacterium]|nr:MAG: hypothetical protein EHM61_10420 [Acidobacteriota bacterium]
MPTLIKKLNLVLRGWGHYHRHVVASETFARIDKYVREQRWRMLRHRHPKKSKPDLFRKYWTDFFACRGVSNSPYEETSRRHLAWRSPRAGLAT